MANKYLNDTGLQYFFNKLKTLFLTNVAYDSTNKKLTKTLNGTTSDIVTVATIKSAMSLAKGDVGLGNVDNTADANKTVKKAGTLTTARNIEGINFNGSSNISHYAICESTATTVNKTATISPTTTNFELYNGARVFVRFQYKNYADNITMNVNNTGAKPVYYGNAPVKAQCLGQFRPYELVYFDDIWYIVGDVDQYPEEVGFGYAVCSTEANDLHKQVLIPGYDINKAVGALLTIKFEQSVPAGSDLEVYISGTGSAGRKPIIHKGAALPDNFIYGGDTCIFAYNGTQYELIAANHSVNINDYMFDDDISVTTGNDLIQIYYKGTTYTAYEPQAVDGMLALKAPLASPALTGTPTAPTAAKATNTTQIATTAFVKTVVGDYATKASPTFTGTPKAPTAAAGTNTTQIATTAFVKNAVDTAIAGVTQFDFQVVTSLPTTGVKGVIYLVAHSHGTGDAYDEYIWTGSAYEKIGNTDIDLSGYMLKTDMVAITTSEIDTLFA